MSVCVYAWMASLFNAVVCFVINALCDVVRCVLCVACVCVCVWSKCVLCLLAVMYDGMSYGLSCVL